MKFDRYTDPGVTVAVALVNTLTEGWAGSRPFALADDPVERRRRALAAVTAVAAGDEAPPAEVEGLYRLARELRAVFQAAEDGATDRAALVVNELLGRYQAAPQLIRHDREPWHLHFHSVEAGLVATWGAHCATGLAIVIGGGNLGRLGICAATRCDRAYVDVSRNGSRRFCSSACLNRTKIAALRARAAAGAGAGAAQEA